jgi:hypothetical protein
MNFDLTDNHLELKWENKSPRLIRRIPLPFDDWASQTFLPNGSRWLFQYGMDGPKAKVKIYDLVGNNFVYIRDSNTKKHFDAFPLPTDISIAQIVGESLSPTKVLFATV